MLAPSVWGQGEAEAIPGILLGTEDAAGLLGLHLEIAEQRPGMLDLEERYRHTCMIRLFFVKSTSGFSISDLGVPFVRLV
jgi:hypothetical protein